MRQRVSDAVRKVRDSELGSTVEKLWHAAGTRPLLVAATFALALLGLISIASSYKSMAARTQGLKQIKLPPSRRLIDDAYAGDVGGMKKLLKKGVVSPNYQDARGRTALMAASEGGHARAVAALLSAGADPDKQDSTGWSSLMGAAGGGHVECMKLLIGAGVNVIAQHACTHTTAQSENIDVHTHKRMRMCKQANRH